MVQEYFFGGERFPTVSAMVNSDIYRNSLFAEYNKTKSKEIFDRFMKQPSMLKDYYKKQENKKRSVIIMAKKTKKSGGGKKC